MQGTKKVHPNRPRHQREFQSICECIYIHLHGVVWLYMKCLLRRHALIHTFIPMCPAVNIYILCMHMYIYTYSHPSGPAHFLNVIYNNILLHLILPPTPLGTTWSLPTPRITPFRNNWFGHATFQPQSLILPSGMLYYTGFYLSLISLGPIYFFHICQVPCCLLFLQHPA